ncbi:MAG: outer membrane lipoprotein-sorting protein [Nitrospina sp.]|jgi:outer membrane lipoprotein-sorting protein|nr:outer membrane lipoprotein-sorting protein [Nitrospina sp.]
MKKLFAGTLLIFLIFTVPAIAEEINAQKLLEQVDENLWANTKFITGRLIIDNGRKVRTLTQDSWMQGVDRSYSHYKSPAREKGTKMLKIGGKLWMYTPRTDRKILIAGHLLRQSMMGSDLSYEDMMEDHKLSHSYSASFEGFEDFVGTRCAVLHLVARDKKTTYQTRKAWIDPEKQIVLKEERFAKSGKLLKRIEFTDYGKIDQRLFPRTMVFRDMLKENTQTTYKFDVIEFDVDIPAKYFSQSILKR